jgi:hypothetical protein
VLALIYSKFDLGIGRHVKVLYPPEPRYLAYPLSTLLQRV